MTRAGFTRLEDELKRVYAEDNEKNNNIVTPGSSPGT